ncbi:Uncharacterized protein TPAR_07965 [Tolypocladium paradoxum]|uniref:Cytochrome b561 domain-containing protein n=1 Tax=Tolypocladium paradoxum TaxID=94208 RepID=A0A2S4KNT7_9HYPO|nr:Uncharacterized protein TPAR_07965 [Tolypocladium paradoxum]
MGARMRSRPHTARLQATSADHDAATALAPSPILAADKDNPPGQSTFVSPGGDLGFAFTVPDNGNSDIFFSLRVPTETSWGAVGLGSDDMKGALFLMIYRNEKGDNVTFSPRVAYGNYEPQLYPDVKFEVLNGTGVIDGYMVFNAKCSEHCRSWPAADSNSGYIDVTSPNQKAVYAVGPKEAFGSDSPAADIKFHREYGVFTIDMKRTQGSPDAPVLTKDSVSEGTTLDYRKTGRSDVKAALHATFMVFCIMAMFPFGVVVLRLGRWARWHGLNQTVAMVGVLAGLGLGVAASFNYQRSRGFRSHHQILGFIIVAFILVQFSLGFLHHTQYRKTQAPTKYGRVHLWLGRLIIFLGVLNAFFGFTFALDRRYGMVLAGLLIFAALAILFVVLGREWLAKKKRFQPVGGPLNGANTGYQPQPWRQDHNQASGSGYPSDPPPGYEPPSQQIGLQPVSSSSSTPWKSSEAKDYEDDPALGRAQRPREFA